MPPATSDDARLVLPPGFVLGTGSAAHQVEGAADVDGRGRSIWDTFAARSPRSDPLGHAGHGVGTDQYHRLPEDLALLRRLGAGAHRFSLSWSRVQPTGSGAVNQAGLDHYDRLVDGLLAAGVRPMATLYHWDLPQALEDDGGWLNRITIERFAEFAALVGERLADRVPAWVPVFAPNIASVRGYGTGEHAPGRTMALESTAVAHHLLVAHGRATVALRAAGAEHVGCANHHAPVWPASDDPADVGATKLFDAMWNGFFLEPMLLGRYPVDLAPLLEDVVEPGDLATIRQPLDFYGIAFDTPRKVAAADEYADLPFELLEPLGYPVTDAGLAVVPDALREWLIMFRARFRAALPPLVVVDSGCAYDGVRGEDGVVDDARRIDYHVAHLRAVTEAVQRGVDVRGYYVSALLDGPDWEAGWSRRIGLVDVDPLTGTRTPKRSFEWLAALIAEQPTSVG